MLLFLLKMFADTLKYFTFATQCLLTRFLSKRFTTDLTKHTTD